MNQNRQPKGIPAGGQFASSARDESAASLVDSTPVESPTVESFAAEVSTLDRRWRDEADVDHVFNGLILSLGKRVLDASEKDRPGYDKLHTAVQELAGARDDDDIAEEALFALSDITARDNMKVTQNPDGSYTRLADGRPGRACPACGNGYATRRVLEDHQRGDCTVLYRAHAAQLSVGDRVLLSATETAVVTSTDGDHKSTSIEFDNDESTIATYPHHEEFQVLGQTDDEFIDDFEALHDIADDRVSEWDDDERTLFLRRIGVKETDIAEAITARDEGDQFALDELARDHAHRLASDAVNNGSDTDALDRLLRGE